MMCAFFNQESRVGVCSGASVSSTSLIRTPEMQAERGGPRRSRPLWLAMVFAVQFLLTLASLAIYRQSASLSSEYFSESIRSSAQFAKDGHRHLLEYQNGLSSSTSDSTVNGLRGSLVHRLSKCSTLSAGRNASESVGLSISTEAERVQHLKCALQRSSSRVGYLLNRKRRDLALTAYGLPTRDIPTVHASDSLDGKLLRELLDSTEWDESYESEVWSQPGEYLMSLQVGNPPRTLQGIVDTGSDLTWLQCRPCARCYLQSDPIYEPRNSATYRELDCAEELCEHVPTSFCNLFTDTCDYMYSYGDNSFTYGTLSTDSFTIENATGQGKEFPGITFGCSHASRGTFWSTGADGVVALGRGELSLASQLAMHLSDRFGYCLVSRNNPTTVTSPIYFGDAAILTGPGARYTPIVNNKRHRAYYFLSMTGISVGGKRLDISPSVFAIDDSHHGGTILDCGTTVTNLVGRAYDALLAAFRTAVEYPTSSSETPFDLCFEVGRGHSVPRFPSLVFHLDGVDLDLPQENYMLQVEDRTFCLAIDRSSENLSVIGNVQQQNYRVLYDRQNSRLGFQPTSCVQE